jgi:hypothetical protein
MKRLLSHLAAACGIAGFAAFAWSAPALAQTTQRHLWRPTWTFSASIASGMSRFDERAADALRKGDFDDPVPVAPYRYPRTLGKDGQALSVHLRRTWGSRMAVGLSATTPMRLGEADGHRASPYSQVSLKGTIASIALLTGPDFPLWRSSRMFGLAGPSLHRLEMEVYEQSQVRDFRRHGETRPGLTLELGIVDLRRPFLAGVAVQAVLVPGGFRDMSLRDGPRLEGKDLSFSHLLLTLNLGLGH